jgi:two-component system, response regulator YesN
MKVLVVDDEPLVRIGIKSCLEWCKYGMEVIGEASDGVEALHMIKVLQPDVVLLDIKMPNMDGIELLNSLKNEGIECKVIILSGFDDLYHVKEAMKLGAIDYLHKPCMNPKDILEALSNIKSKLEKESYCGDASSGKSQKDKRMVKEFFLKELLNGQIIYDNEIEKRLKENNVKFKNNNINCLVFCIKNLNEVKKRYKGPETDILQSSVFNIMSEVLTKESMVDFTRCGDNIYVIITSSEGIVSEKRMHENVNSIIYLAMDALKEFLNVEIIMGVSNTYPSCKEMQRAFGEALKAMKFKFYSTENHIIRFNDIKQCVEKDALIFVDSLISKMKIHLTKQDYSEFGDTFNKMISFLKREACLSEEEVKKLSNGLMFIVKEGKECFHDMEMVNNFETLEQLHDFWKGLIEESLSTSHGINSFKPYSYLIKSIIKFLEENYPKEISLNMLANNFKVSPNYISRLFREETEINLFNYLNILRIEKAKSLLLNLELKIYEVGFKVGFKSTVHFNIVFNKTVGISPKQFRDNL